MSALHRTLLLAGLAWGPSLPVAWAQPPFPALPSPGPRVATETNVPAPAPVAPPAGDAGPILAPLAPSPLPPPAPGLVPPHETAPEAAVPVRPARRRGPPRIVLGERETRDKGEWAGAGILAPGKFDVKLSGTTLRVLVAGAADSHAWLCVPSANLVPYRLVQEFELRSGNPDDPRVSVVLSGVIDGYVRSDKPGAAWLRQADAVVMPIEGGEPLSISFAGASAADGTAARCDGRSQAPPVLLPAGRYVLTVTLVLETLADGILRGHAAAVFLPDFSAGVYRAVSDEVDGLDSKPFGLNVVLRAAAPTASPR